MIGGRPKGYMDWNPRPEVMEVVAQSKQVLREYAQYGPMTVRQIFYRLVGAYGYDKTEKAYKRLAEYLVKARRSGMISFHSIRDSDVDASGGGGWKSHKQFWPNVRRNVEWWSLDRQIGQPYDIELWCEAAGMVPMVAGMLEEWSIPVYSTGGFSSVTVVKETADRIARNYERNDRPTMFLHVGDFDPSGESIFTSLSQDIGSFVASEFGAMWKPYTGEVEEIFFPRRVALTAEQVEQYDLPTAPPKASDSRSANWVGETTQAEALPPSLLEDILKAKVVEFINQDAYNELLAREEEERDLLMEQAEETVERYA